jgi:hypothetical protein
MSFTQAQIPVENTQAFEPLKASIANAYSTGNADAHLRKLQDAGIRVRDFEGQLSAGLFGADGQQQYSSLTPAEQGLIREFFLSQIEQVSSDMRFKYRKLYGYY